MKQQLTEQELRDIVADEIRNREAMKRLEEEETKGMWVFENEVMKDKFTGRFISAFMYLMFSFWLVIMVLIIIGMGRWVLL